MPSLTRLLAITALATALSACASVIPDSGGPRLPSGVPAPAPTPAPTETAARPTPAPAGTPLPAPAPPADAANARSAGVQPGRDVASLGLTPEGASRALGAFRISCPALVRRADSSGLAQPADWQPACDAARGWDDRDAIRFFATHFRTVQVGDGRGLATGYYEPEILGSRTRRPGYEVPVYGLPADLIEADLGQWNPDLAGRRIRGRVDGNRFVQYHDRAAIDAGALAGRNLEIAWAADPVEFFFLQIQGSGRLRLPDGSIMRIGYAGQNGRDYVGIGRLLRDRGVLQPGEASMQGLMGYLRRQPDGGRAVMQENSSWVFFRELTGPGPLGALGLPVTPRASVAADPAYVPLGAPVFLAFDRAEATGLWIAQDTGGAIRGANRFDTFWGAGDDARAIAGGMSSRGAALILLPVASVARLTGGR
jgi:membrane-bound lytic murein transglycosylase A